MTATEPGTPRFADLGLREEILRAIADSGYATPTPIQARAIPEILRGRDVVGVAQTGTGKTASFVLPMIEKLAAGRARARMPRSLILSPTRELATQTARNFETYGKYLKLTMALLIGGVGMGDQEKALEKGVDVLIATPGRLLDWFERGRILLGGVQILVIDEADRMLDMGFIPDVERITSLLTKREQTLLFSATFDKAIRKLASQFMRDPVEITVARPATTAATVDDRLVPVQARDKFKVLKRLIEREAIETAIIFANRKREVASLNRQLQKAGFNARDIHGDLDQPQRQATLDAFKAGQVSLLVATDVAARGLDISDMPCVINYDVPTHAEDYVHRIGRTGRAGKTGRAFTLVTEDEAKYVQAIEKLTGRTIPRLGEGAAETAAAPPPPATTAVAEDAEKPARKPRRRRTRAEAPAPAEPVALPVDAPAPVEAVAGDAVAEAAEAPGDTGKRRRRRGGKAGDEVAVEPVAALPRGQGKRERRPGPPEPADQSAPEGAITAFGGLVPAFLLQPIPALAAVAGEDD